MLQARTATEKLTNVRFLDQQPRETIPAFIAASDVCLVLLRSAGLFKTVIPSKIFEFFGSGRPLALGVEGEAKALVEASGGGVAFPPEDAGRLEALLLELAADPDRLARMGASGRQYVEANFSRAALARRYLDILGEVAGKPALA
jgi:glycosyltransferase involved in cell wall biosynthesis